MRLIQTNILQNRKIRAKPSRTMRRSRRLITALLLISCGFFVKPTDAARSTHHHRPDSLWSYRQSQRNILTFLVASEGLAQSIRMLSLVQDEKDAKDYEYAAPIICGLNTIVLLAWTVTQFLPSYNGYIWMASHFLLPSDKSSRRMRPHTIVTSAFSHYDLEHFLSNMAALRAFVPGIVCDLGCRRFAYFYIASAYASTIFDSIIFSRHIGTHNYKCSLGASGILSAVMTFHCLSFPKKTFEVSGVALSAPLGALAWAINEALLLRGDDNIGHGHHLGGALFGAIVYSVMTLLQSKSRKQILKWIRNVCCSSQKRRQLCNNVLAAADKVIKSIDQDED